MKKITIFFISGIISLMLLDFQCMYSYKKNYNEYVKEEALKKIIGTWENPYYSLNNCERVQVTFREGGKGKLSYFKENDSIASFSCEITWDMYADEYYNYDFCLLEFKPYLVIYRTDTSCAACDKNPNGYAPDTTTYMVYQIDEKGMVLYLKGWLSTHSITNYDMFHCTGHSTTPSIAYFKRIN